MSEVEIKKLTDKIKNLEKSNRNWRRKCQRLRKRNRNLLNAENKYNIGDNVRTKIHYQNDTRTEVDAIIRGVELDDETNEVRYKIWFEPDDFHKRQGSTGCRGYIGQDDILCLYQ